MICGGGGDGAGGASDLAESLVACDDGGFEFGPSAWEGVGGEGAWACWAWVGFGGVGGSGA